LRKFLRLLIFFIATYSGFSQGISIELKGKVTNANNDVSDILIVNLNSKKSTITDSLGVFTIEVKLRDSIQFTAVQYKTKQIVVTESIFNQKSLLINLIEDVIDLKEVTVTPYNLSGELNFDLERLNVEPLVNSSTLRLPNANLEKMSRSEQLLFEADQGKYFYFGLGFTINTHKLLNRVSGRTKSLEDMVEHHENSELEEEIVAKFTKETMSESFDIPLENIDMFLTYCSFQEDFSNLSQSMNNVEIWNYLKRKSVEFKNVD